VRELRELRDSHRTHTLVFFSFVFIYCFLFPLVDQDSLLYFSFLFFLFFLKTHPRPQEEREKRVTYGEREGVCFSSGRVREQGIFLVFFPLGSGHWRNKREMDD
jgi:hypothetical protein